MGVFIYLVDTGKAVMNLASSFPPRQPAAALTTRGLGTDPSGKQEAGEGGGAGSRMNGQIFLRLVSFERE